MILREDDQEQLSQTDHLLLSMHGDDSQADLEAWFILQQIRSNFRFFLPKPPTSTRSYHALNDVKAAVHTVLSLCAFNGSPQREDQERAYERGDFTAQPFRV